MSSSMQINFGFLSENARSMMNLKNRYDEAISGVLRELQDTNENWSVKLRGNFTAKITSCQEVMIKIRDALQAGHDAATSGATSFEELDKYLAELNRKENYNNTIGSWIGGVWGGVRPNANASAIQDGFGDANEVFDDYMGIRKESMVPGYDLVLRNSDGTLNLQAFNQQNTTYKTFTWGDEAGQATGMATAGCNLCSSSYVLSEMGCDIDPITLYYRCEAGRGGLTYQAVADQLGAGSWVENDVYQLNRYIEESLSDPTKYSKPVICCSAYNGYGTHYLAVTDFVKDANGNVVDYMVMDPGVGQIRQLSQIEYLPNDWDGTKIIMSCNRYVKG